MKVLLMHKDRDFTRNEIPKNSEDLINDLGLDVIFEHMSKGDQYILDISKEVLLNPLTDRETIVYRQEILKDALKNPEIIRSLYKMTIEVEESKREKWWGIFGWKTPANVLSGARRTLEALLEFLRKLRKVADENSERFHSEGFRNFFDMIKRELSDEYLRKVEDMVEKLKFQRGVLLKVSIGEGNEGRNYTLIKPLEKKWFQKILNRQKVYSYRLNPRDEAGAQALDELRNKGISEVTSVVACAADHIEGFFKKLRREIAFYVASINLYESLRDLEIPVTFPSICEDKRISFENLINVSLALTNGGKVVGNDLKESGKELFIITGANRGGKTTFLRSFGQAILMMQAGMYTTAKQFTSGLYNGVFTHFRREEDENMRMGKFEEELSRISDIVDQIKPGALLLLNEFLSSTNEREGSEIAYQIVKALVESNVSVMYVTHMYTLAKKFSGCKNALFLRAERTPDGKRTFKIKEGNPLPTSFGSDIYKKLFGEEIESPMEEEEGCRTTS